MADGSASATAYSRLIAIVGLSASAALLLAKAYWDMRRQLERERLLRQTERTGRTKAERRLRKEVNALINAQLAGGLSFRPIARARTPFRGRCGTPRQPLLAPHALGQIILDRDVSSIALDSLEQFSHLWLIFVFHKNTNYTESMCQGRQRLSSPAKIAPPRLGGKRVGCFSTRSPHRPNPIGLSVVQIRRVDVRRGIVDVSGIDLCNGTPILDLKPYIPYDIVQSPEVPRWVVDVDIPHLPVRIEQAAEQTLRQIVDKRQSPLYMTYENMRAFLSEILLQDPRSLHQGRGTCEAGTGGKPPYRIHLDRFVIEVHWLRDQIQVLQAYEEENVNGSDDSEDGQGGDE